MNRTASQGVWEELRKHMFSGRTDVRTCIRTDKGNSTYAPSPHFVRKIINIYKKARTQATSKADNVHDLVQNTFFFHKNLTIFYHIIISSMVSAQNLVSFNLTSININGSTQEIPCDNKVHVRVTICSGQVMFPWGAPIYYN